MSTASLETWERSRQKMLAHGVFIAALGITKYKVHCDECNFDNQECSLGEIIDHIDFHITRLKNDYLERMD